MFTAPGGMTLVEHRIAAIHSFTPIIRPEVPGV